MMAIVRHHSWYPITDCLTINIAGKKLLSPNLETMNIPNNFYFAGGVFLKGSNCIFSTTFVGNTQNRIKNQDSMDLEQTLALVPKAPAGNMQKGSHTGAGITEAVHPAHQSRQININTQRQCLMILSQNHCKKGCNDGVGGLLGNANPAVKLASF